MRISFEFTNRKRLASIRISKIAYDIRHNVYNSFDIESSKGIIMSKIFQNRTSWCVEQKKKMLRQNS